MPNPKSTLDFFAEAVSAAGNKFTPEKYKRDLDDIFDAAQHDSQAEIVLVFRKGDQVALVGMKDGRMVQTSGGFAQVLRPIVSGL